MKLKLNAVRLGLIVIILAIIAVAVMWFLSLPALAPNAGLQPETSQSGTDNNDDKTFPVQTGTTIDDSQVTAKSYLVYDIKSNSVLASKAPKTVVSIASLTKLMTGYLVNSFGQIGDIVTIKPEYVLDVNPSLGLKNGDKVKVGDLFNAMMVGSANDAALTLGHYLEEKQGKPIAEIMNEQAKQLGMADSHFSTPVGFDSDTNYSTASDMELLVHKTTSNPSFININRLLSYSFVSDTGQSYSVTATNKLLATDPQIHAIKTGFTNDAGGAMIVSVQTGTGEFVIILLGSENREKDTLLLKESITQKFYAQ